MGRCKGWVLAAAVLANPMAMGQEVIHQITGSAMGDFLLLGAALGDVDGDGFDDFAVSASRARLLDGAAWIHSGQTGRVLFPLQGSYSGEQFGYSLVALDDTDGDGIRDLVVGAPYAAAGGGPPGQLYLFSGATGILRRTIPGITPDGLGYVLERAGDVDADGSGDFLSVHLGRVDVYSGATGTVVLSIPTSGVTRAVGAPDLNADGHDDVLCGMPQESGPAGEPFMGWVRAYSGKDGSLLFQQSGGAAYDQLGGHLDIVRDLDGDGLDDYLVSAEGADGLVPDSGALFLHSASNQGLIRRIDGFITGQRFGLTSAAVGDVNGDGFDDVAVVTGPTETHLYSGHTGGLLHHFASTLICCGSVDSIAAAGDVNNDGFDDILRGFTIYGQGLWFDPGTVMIHGGNDLWLEAPAIGYVGLIYMLTTRGGAPGGPSLLVVVGVDGVPLFQPVRRLWPFDATGARVDLGAVAPALSGLQLSFQAYGQASTGLNGASAVSTVSFF